MKGGSIINYYINNPYNSYLLNTYYNYRKNTRYTEIQIGDSNNDVVILQDKLKLLNYYFLSITGNFDKNTQTSVKLFQKENNLPITGIVDTTTWNLLYDKTSLPTPKLISNNPTLKLGDTGNDVKLLQQKLKILTYFLNEINSVFDKNTQIAVKQFQLNNFLTPDGIVGINTWSKINILYEPLTNCENFTIPENTGTYIVQKKDTLYSIAKKFNTTVNELKNLNNLTSDLLSIGQILNIVKISVPEISSYTVLKGDTLYSIAKKFNTTVDKILNLNNLSSNLLSIGQILKIPLSDNPNTNTYIVKKGDTLYSIAKKLDTSVDEIKALNNLSSNILSINQSLLIP